MADPTRSQTTKPTNMELGTTPPKHSTNGLSALPPPQMRVLSTSNSFDSKSSIPNFGPRFQMSAEATKLFQTLQQSPLPINAEVRHFIFNDLLNKLITVWFMYFRWQTSIHLDIHSIKMCTRLLIRKWIRHHRCQARKNHHGLGSCWIFHLLKNQIV